MGEIERILNVALRLGEVMFVPVREEVRHGDIIRSVHEAGIDTIECEQGFVTDRGRFVDREEAFAIANFAGQIGTKTGGKNSRDLFSEDVW